MNAWGTPDWRDGADYGDVSDWTLDRWRWEFYRRRTDLRTHFDERADGTYQYWKQHAGKPGFPMAHLRPDEPGFCVSAGSEGRLQFGYAGIPNPRIGEQPIWALWTTEYMTRGDIHMGARSDHVGFRGTIGEYLEQAGIELSGPHKIALATLWELYPVSIPTNQIALKFNLDHPLEAQLKQAREILKKEQSDLHGKLLQRRRDPKAWLIYLRVLDAGEAGASWAEITDTLYSQGLLDFRKAPEGGYCAPPPQAGRDKWKAANALRFNF